MDDTSSVQLGQAQAGLMCTAQQGHQVGLALPIYQPPIVHSMLQECTSQVSSKKHCRCSAHGMLPNAHTLSAAGSVVGCFKFGCTNNSPGIEEHL